MKTLRLRTALLAVFGFSLLSSSTVVAATDIVLYATDASAVSGAWRKEADSTAAGGNRLRHPNAGAAKLAAPLVSPADYFEMTFTAEGGVAYRLWMRGKADSNYWGNDSVFVQFSDSVNTSGSAAYRIGSTSATTYNLEDCNGYGLSGWGWQDNGYGAGVLGPVITFAATGTHTIRVQTREDGLSIDQVVLSPSTYLKSSPGALNNDTTIVPRIAPAVTLVRGPYLQEVTSSSAVVVWATREGDASDVQYAGSTGSSTVNASTSLFPASTTGLPYDYYQHYATLTSLHAATTYSYDIFTGGADATPGRSFQLTTAPAASSTATVRFVAFGDSGVGSTAQRQLAARIAADTFDFALHAGDLAYGSSDGTGDGSYTTLSAWFFDIYNTWLHRRPVWPAEGNHDSRASNNNGVHYVKLFHLPNNERYYSFNWGQAHVVVLDTEYAFQDSTRRQQQLDWADADLGATDRPWKIAVFHRSPYSSGGEHGSDLAVRQAFGPIFERHGVQLAISAHEHDYERTWPQQTTSGGSPVVYVVTGGGGGPLYPSGTSSFTAVSASRHHFLRGAIGDCSLNLEAVAADGTVFDATTLNRCTAPTPAPGGSDVVIYGSDVATAGTLVGNWTAGPDSTAAARTALENADKGAAKITTARASPADYFEYSFYAEGGTPYRLWIRGRATNNYWGNDSVYVQFDGDIGTTTAHTVNLEDCNGCGLSGWGWQDNGWGPGVMGPSISLPATGTHRVRVQVREDGFIIDQIVLSPSKYLNASPGALKNDTTIVPK